MISFLNKCKKKFQYAFAGLWDGMFHDQSIILQFLLAFIVLIVCACLSLTRMEWVIIIFAIGFVLALEFINSAIEEMVDMVCPQWDVRAKKIKDYAAAAVLIASLTAAFAGICVIGGKIF